MRRSTFLAGVAVSLFAACNARGLDFDALPLLERRGSPLYDSTIKITKFHHNGVTNGVMRNWLEFHVKSCHGSIPDVTNITVMCCETVQKEFHGSGNEHHELPREYFRMRRVTPWRPLPEAEVLKLREELVYDGMCLMCSGGERHAFFSATVDTADSLGDYGGLSHGFAFYVVAECVIRD